MCPRKQETLIKLIYFMYIIRFVENEVRLGTSWAINFSVTIFLIRFWINATKFFLYESLLSNE